MSASHERDPEKRFRKALESFLHWGVGARLLLVAVLYYFGVNSLAPAFFGGAMLYMVLIWLLRHWDLVKPAVVILNAEWAALCALSFLHFGTNSGLHLIVMLLALVVINLDMFSARLRMIMVMLPVSGSWFIHPLFAAHTPWVRLSKTAETQLTIVNITIFSFLVAQILLYLHRTRENEKLAIAGVADARMRLVSDLSHEIKTPLAAILTTVQGALQREQTAAEYQSALQLCERNTRYLARLSHRMLDLAREEGCHMESQWSHFDPHAILLDVASTEQAVAEKKRVSLEVEGQPGLEVVSDADKLRIIVGNLVENAIRHSGEGQWVRLSCGAVGEDEFFCRVADCGGGIAPEDLPHIFEAFYRADKSRNRKEQSYGLGLAIAAAMAKGMGGRIEVDSEPGKGAAFTVVLPRRR